MKGESQDNGICRGSNLVEKAVYSKLSTKSLPKIVVDNTAKGGWEKTLSPK